MRSGPSRSDRCGASRSVSALAVLLCLGQPSAGESARGEARKESTPDSVDPARRALSSVTGAQTLARMPGKGEPARRLRVPDGLHRLLESDARPLLGPTSRPALIQQQTPRNGAGQGVEPSVLPEGPGRSSQATRATTHNRQGCPPSSGEERETVSCKTRRAL